MNSAYPAKIIIAWGEAISGNRDIRAWLMANGYPELGLFVYALHHKEDARRWLIENGHAHLMALINGAEGQQAALHWLNTHGFDVLENMARHRRACRWPHPPGRCPPAAATARPRGAAGGTVLKNRAHPARAAPLARPP